jgi:serine/threonine-protein kinase SRPK3
LPEISSRFFSPPFPILPLSKERKKHTQTFNAHCSCLKNGILRNSQSKHVAVKLYIQSDLVTSHLQTELEAYKRIEKATQHHPGRTAIRTLLDSFEMQGPKGPHHCLVHPALWESVLDLRHRNPIQRLPVPVVAVILKRLFQALDLLHNECRIAHADIKEANILLGADDAVLADFEREQLENPCPRKELLEGTVYQSRELSMPRLIGDPMLCDFGSAVPLDDGHEHREDIQPNIYRAPEVILDIPWSYSVDIWNVGCVVGTSGGHVSTGEGSFGLC